MLHLFLVADDSSDASQSRATSKGPQTISLKAQMVCALQTAAGMAALAAQRIVHRDLAA